MLQVNDAINVLPKLQTGLDVNVRYVRERNVFVSEIIENNQLKIFSLKSSQNIEGSMDINTLILGNLF